MRVVAGNCDKNKNPPRITRHNIFLVFHPTVSLAFPRLENLWFLGVPQGSTQNTLVATYNDLANVEELIKGGDVAAVILEPVVGNSGFIKPTEVNTVVDMLMGSSKS